MDVLREWDQFRSEEEKNVECSPLLSVAEVKGWKPERCTWKVRPLAPRSGLCSAGASQLCHCTSHQPTRLLDRHSVPRTLICHDKQGGYLDDRFVYGSDKHTEYRFFHWAAIDIFVYFSHRFVTVCPPVWVNAAHLHGVQILGTIITEWDTGKKELEELLHSDAEQQAEFVQQLVLMCEHYGMDGWLINIENKVEPEDVLKLKNFVAQLTEAMHEKIPHSHVIWYDSVINTGQLKWQNELNEKNRMFFDVCDGIFLNYVWKEENLENSLVAAGARAWDVFVGVDIFGRNCYGGGGFKTNEAVERARAHDLSVALFAQGWVHECWAQENFTPLEYTFWRKLWTLLFVHGPAQMPFQTSFCQGYGLKKYQFGKVVDPQPWHNLSLQMPQPCLPLCVPDGSDVDPTKETEFCTKLSGCVQHWAHDAFVGGGCLLLQRHPPKEELAKKKVFHKILLCSLDIGAGADCLFSCALKIPEESMSSLDELQFTLLCQDSQRGSYRLERVRISSAKNSEASNIIRLPTYLQQHVYNKWVFRCFQIPKSSKPYKIKEVCCAMGPKTTEVLLGWLSIHSIEK